MLSSYHVADQDLLKKWSSPSKGKMSIKNIQNESVRENMARLLENVDTGAVGMLTEAGTFDTGIGGVSVSNNLAGNIPVGGASMGVNPSGLAMALQRRTFPALFANKVVGVQAMSGPVGLAAAMRFRYTNPDGSVIPGIEAGWDYIPEFSNYTGALSGTSGWAGQSTSGEADAGTGAAARYAEAWMLGASANDGRPDPKPELVAGGYKYPELTMQIDRQSIYASTRKLATSVSLEAIQDLKAMWSIDVEKEILNMIQFELVAELDREILQNIKRVAQKNGTGILNLASSAVGSEGDGDARWQVEKSTVLCTYILSMANNIAVSTRRFPGNFAIVSPSVATLLQAAATNIWTKADVKVSNIESMAEIGTLYGQIKVFIDQFAETDYVVVGYKGDSIADAGIVYAPYVTGLVSRAVSHRDFSPRIGVMSRYAIVDSLMGAERYYRYAEIQGITNIVGVKGVSGTWTKTPNPTYPYNIPQW